MKNKNEPVKITDTYLAESILVKNDGGPGISIKIIFRSGDKSLVIVHDFLHPMTIGELASIFKDSQNSLSRCE